MKLTFALLSAVLICAPAHAGVMLSIQPSPVVANPGDTGDVFDVVLTNTTGGSIAVAGFSFEVSVTDPDITLTSADFSPTLYAYIFAGDSLDQDAAQPLNTTSGQTLDGSDIYDIPGSAVTLTNNTSLALGEVFFSVSPTAALGPFAVSFNSDPAATSLTDASGNSVGIDTFTNGTINIVPEPSALPLTLAALAAFITLASRRRA
jgi:hypothetical protein